MPEESLSSVPKGAHPDVYEADSEQPGDAFKRIETIHRNNVLALGIEIGTRLKSIPSETIRTVRALVCDDRGNLLRILTSIDSEETQSGKVEFTVREISLGFRMGKFEVLSQRMRYVGGQDD